MEAGIEGARWREGRGGVRVECRFWDGVYLLAFLLAQRGRGEFSLILVGTKVTLQDMDHFQRS